MRSKQLLDGDGGQAVVERFRAVVTELVELPTDTLALPQLCELLEATETARCQLPVIEHRAINAIVATATPEQVGKSVKRYLADRLRIHPGEAQRRIADAQMLGASTSITGEVLEPRWAATADGQRAGAINTDHVAEIRRFFHRLPSWIDEPTRARAEQTLAELAAKHRPDELRTLADKLADCLNPDGDYTDADRAHRRGITIGRQDIDGMSQITGWLTPECRAGIDAVFSKLAAPAMCNPADESPVVDGSPSQAAIDDDTRSRSQRNHDALNAMCRSTLASGELGSHHGLPVSIVVTTTLQELETAAGIAGTGGGSWLPMPDVIRMASHARHFLRIYDKHTSLELYLGATKRIATPAQRIVLHAKDRGCTRPGCTAPGYLCEVHHIEGWANTHRTDIDNLTFVCGPDHRLLDDGWTVRKNEDGITEWIPPPHLDFGKPTTNAYFHPERYFRMHADDKEDP